MTATLTRPLTGTFTVKERPNSGWDDVEFRSDTGGIAVAELQVTGRKTWGKKLNGENYTEQRGVWGVKVVDENRQPDESKRGRGLGTALMQNLVDHADHEQWELWLKCEPHRSGEFIVGFYERFGFVAFRSESDNGFTMHDDPTIGTTIVMIRTTTTA